MKTKMITALLNVAIGVSLHAGLRSSSDFSITTETLNAGGRRAISTNYTNDGSVGEVAGISTVAAPAETAKSGYLGQIYDITGLTLTAVSLNVNESTTDQLAAWQTLDDATFLAVPAASVAWSVQSGPLTGISASGLATAGIVFQDTAAAAQGIYLGNTGTLGLTVKIVNFDDFGSYGGDGLDDAWQNEYFGLNNPQAAPGADPDGDGENNAFEFTAGLGPTDPASPSRSPRWPASRDKKPSSSPRSSAVAPFPWSIAPPSPPACGRRCLAPGRATTALRGE